jgi:hypothetical protein
MRVRGVTGQPHSDCDASELLTFAAESYYYSVHMTA